MNFCSLLSYNPKGNTTIEAINSRVYLRALKKDNSPTQYNPVIMSEYIAEEVRKLSPHPPFSTFFKSNTVLVPIPGHAVTREASFWGSKRIAEALHKQGLGIHVCTCIERLKEILPAHMCKPEDRPDLDTHYNSIAVRPLMIIPEEILLIDDIVTSGTIALTCANILKTMFPHCNIQLFAAMRTMTNPNEFRTIHDAVAGNITASPCELSLDDFSINNCNVTRKKYNIIRRP